MRRCNWATRCARVSTIDDVKLKTGRSGELCFVRVRHEVSTSRGLALREFHDIVYRPNPVPGASEPTYEEAPPSVLARRSCPTTRCCSATRR